MDCFISIHVKGDIWKVSLHESGGGNWVDDSLLFVKLFSKYCAKEIALSIFVFDHVLLEFLIGGLWL